MGSLDLDGCDISWGDRDGVRGFLRTGGDGRVPVNGSEVREKRRWTWLMRVRGRVASGGENILDSNVVV